VNTRPAARLRRSTAPVTDHLHLADADAYVRDRGRGFDPATVPASRVGIAEFVIGRMAQQVGANSVA
jgi:hypothetical protein